MTPEESQLLESTRAELMAVKIALINERAKLEALAKCSGELERTAQLVAAQATELCRQLRGGGMEHLKTEP